MNTNETKACLGLLQQLNHQWIQNIYKKRVSVNMNGTGFYVDE